MLLRRQQRALLRQIIVSNNISNNRLSSSSLLLPTRSVVNSIKPSLASPASQTRNYNSGGRDPRKIDRVVGPLGYHDANNYRNSSGGDKNNASSSSSHVMRPHSMDGDTVVVSARASDIIDNQVEFYNSLQKQEENRKREMNLARNLSSGDYRKRPKIFWYVAAIFALLFSQEIYSYYALCSSDDELLNSVLDMLQLDSVMEEELSEHNIPIHLSVSRVRNGVANDLDRYVCYMSDSLDMIRNLSYKDHGVQLLMQKRDVLIPRLLNILEHGTREEIKHNAAHILFMLTRYDAFSRCLIEHDGIERMNKLLLHTVYSSKFKNRTDDKLTDMLRRTFIQMFDYRTVNQDIAQHRDAPDHGISLVIQMAQFDNPSWLSRTALSCLENICENHVQYVKSVGAKQFDSVEKTLITSNKRFMAGLQFLMENGKTAEVKQRATQVFETLTRYSSKDVLSDSPDRQSIVTRIRNQIVKEYGARDYLAVMVFASLIPLTVAYMAKNYAKRGAPKEFFYRKLKLVGGTFVFTDFVLHPSRFALQSYHSPVQRERTEPDRRAFEKWGLLTALIYGLHLFAYYNCPYAHAVYVFRFMPFMTLDTYTNAFDGTNRVPYFTFQKLRRVQMDAKALKARQKAKEEKKHRALAHEAAEDDK